MSLADLSLTSTVAPESEIALDYRAIKSGAGMRVLDDRLIVRVTGEDRVSFMHGMCTADIKGLKPGAVAPALFVTERAHVIADCFVYALENEALWLEVERPRWAAVREHLEKLLVADDVEMEELEAMTVLDIEGPDAPAAVRAVFGGEAGELTPWSSSDREHIRVANLPRYLGPAFTLIGERDPIAAVVAKIRQKCPETRALSAESLEIVRIENGLARVGVDTTERTLALEARLERAISFNKGCYVGQETIERATARGALKHALRGLRMDGASMPAIGSVIRLADKEVGKLSSAAPLPDGGIVALAMLHHSAWPAGTSVIVGDGAVAIPAIVSESPPNGL
ncbi:MAG TPA: hypothetical protein VJN94_14255 [Candidatus Binataceae bacterium]|nr:hypothetical protein [Candidatus Binataceae bacterium]